MNAVEPKKRAEALRYPVDEAADKLRMGERSLWRLIKAGEFTIVRNKLGKCNGRGSKVYLLADEVHTFAEKELAGLRDLRKRKGRK